MTLAHIFVYTEDTGGLGKRGHVFCMMYEFFIGFVAGIGIAWVRKPSKCDMACQVEPPPLPTKPVVIPGPTRKRLKGIPELANFWD
jgi:hypothetical protein